MQCALEAVKEIFQIMLAAISHNPSLAPLWIILSHVISFNYYFLASSAHFIIQYCRAEEVFLSHMIPCARFLAGTEPRTIS